MTLVGLISRAFLVLIRLLEEFNAKAAKIPKKKKKILNQELFLKKINHILASPMYAH